MKEIIYNSKPLKVLDVAEVVIVGGGTTGSIAAISALHEGKDVIVLEKGIALGGSATRALVVPHMGTRVGTGTLIKEINNEYLAYDSNAWTNGGEYALFVNCEEYAAYLDQKIRSMGGRIYYEATFIDTIMYKQKIEYVIAYIFNALYAIKAQTFVDTSSEALVAKSTGIELLSGDEESGLHQAVSLRFEMGNVDKAKLCEYLKTINYNGFGIPEDPNRIEFVRDTSLFPLFDKAIETGDVVPGDVRYLQAFRVPNKPNTFAFNCPQLPNIKDINNPKDFSYYVSEGRQSVRRFSRFLIKYIPGFEQAYVSQIANMLGIRESVRIKGDYVITEQDYIERKVFEDGIAKADWYVDVHYDDDKYDKNENQLHYKPGEYYEIPYRSLISQKCDNLICGGRIISTSFKVQASVRIQPTLRDIGEVIGKACAYSINKGVDLNKINGALLRTFK